MKYPIERFPLQSFDKIRYADTDRQGHVNNAVFATFIETGRVEMLYHPENPLAAAGCSFVIAQLDIKLIAELYWPGQVDIVGAVSKIGNSSFQIQQHLFQDGRHAASARSVLVQINTSTKRPQALSETARERLYTYLRDNSESDPLR